VHITRAPFPLALLLSIVEQNKSDVA